MIIIIIQNFSFYFSITNTTFTNCYSNYGYLIYLKTCNNLKAVNVKNSTFSGIYINFQKIILI